MPFAKAKIKAIPYVINLIVIFACMHAFHNAADAQDKQNEKARATVVLDSGHGGTDAGVKGPEGTLEKDVTLNLARMVAAELSYNYHVVLTRTEDYTMGHADRAATANTQNASLFISIHIGGSFLRAISGGSIYYFETLESAETSAENGFAKSSAQPDCKKIWDCIQTRHSIQSRVLASVIQDQLVNRIEYWNFNVRGAPLIVLKGADMPAILIEVGHLTHPADEKVLSDPSSLLKIAQAISTGIKRFLERTP